MNADAVSDLALAAACCWVVALRVRARPGFAVAAGLIGLAAAFGVLAYAGVGAMRGPHAFASLVAASAAFPLLAFAIAWPDDPTAARTAGAARFALLAGAIGVAATAGGLGLWAQAVPAASALVVAWSALRSRGAAAITGAALLLAGLAAAAAGPRDGAWLGALTRIQVLHYLLAGALLALARATRPTDRGAHLAGSG